MPTFGQSAVPWVVDELGRVVGYVDKNSQERSLTGELLTTGGTAQPPGSMGGGAPVSVPGSTSIVMDAAFRIHDSYTVAGPTTITVSGTMKGARSQMLVIADGTNVPTVVGATEWAFTMGYDNRAGYPNLLDIEHVGALRIFGWSQAMSPAALAPAPPAPTPPAPTPPAPAPATPPGAVQSLTAGTPTSTTIPLAWAAPITGDAATDYEVQYATAGTSFASPTTFADGTGTATSATITGLTAETAYDVRVRATNATGSSAYATLTNISTAAAPAGGQAGTPVTFAGTAYLSSLGGELYEATSFGTNFAARGWVTETLAGDGWIEVQYPNNTNVSTIFGLDAAAAGDTITYGQMDFTVVMAGAGGVSAGSNTTTFGTAVTTLTPSATTRVRIRRAGSTLMVETTTDDWATATLRHTFSTTSSSPLSARWFTSYSGTAKRICQPRATGLA